MSVDLDFEDKLSLDSPESSKACTVPKNHPQVAGASQSLTKFEKFDSAMSSIVRSSSSTLANSGASSSKEGRQFSANMSEHRLTNISGPGSLYVKLNVGGSLHYTTIATLTKQDSMLRAMFSGRMEVLTDSEGWILIDRCGKHFPAILNYLRDGSVALPDCRREVIEILAEAKYYCLQGLVDTCQTWLDMSSKDDHEPVVCRAPIIATAKEERSLLHSSGKPAVKLLLNRGNNKYSYTPQSDDNLLKNQELFDKLAMRFYERVLFIKDVGAANEVCSWTFFGHTRKVAEVCCTSIVYATDKKHTKVEFPEARILEEAMNILLYEENTMCPSCQGCQAQAAVASVHSSASSSGMSSPTDAERQHSEKIQKARAVLRTSREN